MMRYEILICNICRTNNLCRDRKNYFNAALAPISRILGIPF